MGLKQLRIPSASIQEVGPGKPPCACARGEAPLATPASAELWLGGTVPESRSLALHFNELRRVS